MSDNDRIPECDDCTDDGGMCDRPHLENGRCFSLTLKEGFEGFTCIPCYARPYVLEKLDFEERKKVDTKKAHLKTKRGFIFEVKVINEEDMKINFDIGPKDVLEDNIDIWVDVDMIPILPPSYFLSSKHERKIVDATYYSYGLELTWKEKNALVSFVNDVQTFKINYEVSQNYSGYVPLVHELSDGNIRANSMKLATCKLRWIFILEEERMMWHSRVSISLS